MEPATSSIGEKLGFVVLVALLALVAWKLLIPHSPTGPPVAVGTPLPALNVAGWLNLPAGESFDPTGKIVVVDCWATWCGPCRKEMPRLAAIAEQYRPLGVEFIGLTDEIEKDLPRIRSFIESVPGFTWPVGYGAFKFIAALDIRQIPTVIVFGPDGRAIWSNVGSYGLEPILDAALAKQQSK